MNRFGKQVASALLSRYIYGRAVQIPRSVSKQQISYPTRPFSYTSISHYSSSTMSVPDTLKVGDYEVHTGLFINNEWVRGNGEAFETINPATEETIGMVSLDILLS